MNAFRRLRRRIRNRITLHFYGTLKRPVAVIESVRVPLDHWPLVRNEHGYPMFAPPDGGSPVEPKWLEI